MTIAVAELRRSGFGSEAWFRQFFVFDNLASKTRAILATLGDKAGLENAIRYIESEITTIITEKGVGEKSLTIQPPTHYSLQKQNGQLSIIVQGIDALGNWAPSFIDFSNEPLPIKVGMIGMFGSLDEADIGEGRMRVSPSSFYENSGSTSDVIHVAFKTGENQAVGWFIFLGQKLTNEERRFLLNQYPTTHQSETNNFLSETDQIATVVRIIPASEGKQITSSDSLNEFMTFMSTTFQTNYNRKLFTNIEEPGLLSQVVDLVRKHSHAFLSIFTSNQKNLGLRTILGMMEKFQTKYAEFNNLDVKNYWLDLVQGRRQIMGIHPTNGEDLNQYWDPLKQEWIGGDACGPESKKKCKLCGKKYEGSNCLKCK